MEHQIVKKSNKTNFFCFANIVLVWWTRKRIFYCLVWRIKRNPSLAFWFPACIRVCVSVCEWVYSLQTGELVAATHTSCMQHSILQTADWHEIECIVTIQRTENNHFSIVYYALEEMERCVEAAWVLELERESKRDDKRHKGMEIERETEIEMENERIDCYRPMKRR